MHDKGNCTFCRIIKGEITPEKLYEDSECLVILDKFPATKGQSLVIPKKHEEYAVTMDEQLYHHLFSVAKNIAEATDLALMTERTCFVVEGFAVPHVHIRLHPCYERRLLLQGKEASNEELRKVGDEIRKELN